MALDARAGETDHGLCSTQGISDSVTGSVGMGAGQHRVDPLPCRGVQDQPEVGSDRLGARPSPLAPVLGDHQVQPCEVRGLEKMPLCRRVVAEE
ncbi:MAG: hypothetical protein KC468_08350 [Myxococcales bacterium]|nr:hypothetical protein [Myxococcales bacterium]